MGKRKYSFEEVSKFFSDRSCELIDDNYVNSKTPLKYKCSCGNISKIALENLLNGQKCKECGIKTRREKSLNSFEKVKSVFEENQCKLLTKEYVGNKSPLEFICKCGKSSTTRFNYFIYSPHCSDCGIEKRSNERKHSINTVMKEFENHNCKLLSKDYINVKEPLKFLCKCGSVGTKSLISFRRKPCCKKCSNQRRVESNSFSHHFVYEYFKNEGCQLLENQYINTKTKMKFKCHCGELGITTFESFKNGMRCGRHRPKGENHLRWRDDLTEEERIINRNFPEYAEWRKAVFKKDNYTCVSCGDTKGGNLNAHHLDGYNWCVEKRTDVTNSATLCEECHKEFHTIYGYGDNTREQFAEWHENKRNTRRDKDAS